MFSKYKQAPQIMEQPEFHDSDFHVFFSHRPAQRAKSLTGIKHSHTTSININIRPVTAHEPLDSFRYLPWSQIPSTIGIPQV